MPVVTIQHDKTMERFRILTHRVRLHHTFSHDV